MRKKITLSFLLVLVCTASVFSQKKAFFIGNSSTTSGYVFPTCDYRDTIAINKLVSQGFTVSFAGDNDTKISPIPDDVTTKMNESNVVIISSTVGSGDVAAITTATVNAGKPLLAWEYGVFDEMKIMAGSVNKTLTTTSATINSAIDSKISGNLGTFTYINTVRGLRNSKGFIQGAGVVNIANVSEKAADGIADTLIAVAQYLKLGELNSDGVAATAPVISFPMFDNDNSGITAEGWELFLRCVCFLADKPYVPTTGIKNVNSDNANVWYSNGNLNIEVPKDLTNSNIAIYSFEGKLVSNTLISGSGRFSASIVNLTNGMYMVVGEGFKGKFIKN